MNQRTFSPTMKAEEILQAIDSIKPGDTVQIQFKKEDVGDVNYLLGMDTNGFLTVCEEDYAIMLAVASSGDWGETPLNRIFQLQANDNWDLQWFKGRLGRRLESVIIVKK